MPNRPFVVVAAAVTATRTDVTMMMVGAFAFSLLWIGGLTQKVGTTLDGNESNANLQTALKKPYELTKLARYTKGAEHVLVKNVDLYSCQNLCGSDRTYAVEERICDTVKFDPNHNACRVLLDYGASERLKPSTSPASSKLVMGARSCSRGRLSFHRFANHVLVGFADVVLRTASVYDCFCACVAAMMKSDDNCRCLMYFYDSNECILNKASRVSHPSSFAVKTKGPRVDYFDRICERVEEAMTTDYNVPSKLIRLDTCPSSHDVTSMNAEATVQKSCLMPRIWRTSSRSHYIPYGVKTSVLGNSWCSSDPYFNQVVTDSSVVVSPTQSQPTVEFQISSDCRYDGVVIHLQFPSPVNGRVFVLNNYATCCGHFRGATNASYFIPFLPTNGSFCQPSRPSPNVLIYTLVVQTGCHSPGGLISSNDRIMTVTCDYGKGLEGYRTSGRMPYASFMQPEWIKANNTSGVRPLPVSMFLLKNNSVVHNAALGEKVQLKWEFSTAEDKQKYWIRDCFAERMGGSTAAPAALQLIKNGCPEQTVAGRIVSDKIQSVVDGQLLAMNLFRFDGSNGLKLRCLVEPCHAGCPTLPCIEDQGGMPRPGRQRTGNKRKVRNKQFALERSYNAVSLEQAVLLITVDRLPASLPVTTSATLAPRRMWSGNPFNYVAVDGRLCLSKLSCVIGFTLIVCVFWCDVFFLAVCRCRSRTSYGKSATQYKSHS